MTARVPASWTPSLGAWIEPAGTAFRVWAPTHPRVDVVLHAAGGDRAHPLTRLADGTFHAVVPGVAAGDRYRYRLGGDRVFPDPASRFQPQGVHGPSSVVDPSRFRWTDAAWSGLDLEDVVLYELHVGTFSPAGTFAGAEARLPALATLGVTAVELMPVADFPGERSWGYDGGALFAPARCYGTPDDLRRFVDRAHRLGLAVFLDVVYNHLGPDGAYPSVFSPYYFTSRHHTPWGAALNFDGEHSDDVRHFFIENACHWVHEYHIDGLRLDATHAIVDERPRPFPAELAAEVRDSVRGRRVHIMAEDHRNLNRIVMPERDGGWGLDAVWADDFHHECRRLLAGDRDGYYRDFSGRADAIAAAIRQGWLYTGQHSVHFGEARGTDPTGLAPERFVFCLQNHDQVGNRALGERLNHEIDPAAFRAAAVLLLLAPQTPLIFMGQEWAASAPFLYFTDHEAALGRLVTAGRRDEFRHFPAFADPDAREQIPDPQALATFLACRLDWSERGREPHASMVRLHQALLEIRRRDAPSGPGASVSSAAPDDDTVVIRRDGPAGSLLVVARLRGGGAVPIDSNLAGLDTAGPAAAAGWRLVLTSEDPRFCTDPRPLRVNGRTRPAAIRFARPSAVVFTRKDT